MGKTKAELIEQGKQTRQKILDFIVSYNLKHKRPPTIREIRDAAGLLTTSTVPYHLRKLQADGLIDWIHDISRGIIPTDLAFSKCYEITYVCFYPAIGGCKTTSKTPGTCPAHATQLIPTVTRRKQ